MADSPQKLRLPRIHKIKLRRFSLFAANPDAEFSAGDGVLCLIGANGIGKSTLLSAINFCLTGIVPDPNRTFESMDEYYKFARPYAASYFRGRIVGSDEDDAEITVSFSIGNVEYEVRRGLFEPDELRGLTITDRKSNTTISVPDEMPRTERHKLYAASLVGHIGLASFQEFVFLQHFVFTFDEQRKTLFWSPRIMERALYRAFGLDPNMAKQADSIRREIQHEDSRVRNYQWEATRMRRRINEIRALNQQASGAQETYEALIASHEQMSQQFDEDSRIVKDAEDALKDANLVLADQSVRETALRDEYARFFDRRFDLRPPLADHPLITQSLADRICALCGTSGDKAQQVIAEKSRGASCPLCDSGVSTKPQSQKDAKRLQEIDKELGKIKKAVGDIHKSIQSLRAVEVKARQQWEATKEKLDEFDRQNSAVLDSLRKVLAQTAREPLNKDCH